MRSVMVATLLLYVCGYAAEEVKQPGGAVELPPMPLIDGYRDDYHPKKSGDIQFVGKGKSLKKKEENLKIEPAAQTAQPAKKIEEKPQTVTVRQLGYTGETKDGRYHGTGTFVFPSGDRYEGEWVEGKRQGTGTYHYACGIMYTGSWAGDRMEGTGTLAFPDGSRYSGDLKAGLISGEGTFSYSDGSSYSGGWKNGKWHGKGIYKLRDGRTLNALFSEGQMVKQLE